MPNINIGSMNTKVLGIVYHNTSNKTAANLLEKLMANKKSIEFQDGKKYNVVSKIMTEKFYCDNENSISSSQKIVFIGDVKEKKNLEPIMKSLYKKHGVTIGQCGNKILITTSSIPLMASVEAYTAFRKDLEHLGELPEVKKMEFFLWALRLSLAFNVANILGADISSFLVSGWFGIHLSRKITEQQELFAAAIFYIRYFDKFMKE